MNVQAKEHGEQLEITINGETRRMPLAIATRTRDGLRFSFAVDVREKGAPADSPAVPGYAEVTGDRGSTYSLTKTGRYHHAGEYVVAGWSGRAPGTPT